MCDRKIIIEDGLSIVQQRGCGQYTQRVFELLKELNYECVLKRKYFLEKIKNNTIRRLLYIFWLNTFFVLTLSFNKKGTICFFSSTVTPLIKLPHIVYVSVIHDIRSKLYPELSTNVQNLHNNFANWSAIKFSDKLVTVSETSKKDIAKIYSIPESNIHIIYNISSLQNVTYDNNETILKRLNIKKGKYLLFVGGLDKNKNVQMIIDSFNMINTQYPEMQLVIAGNKGNSNLIISNKNIILTGFIINEDLKVLYKNALVFIFPSIYEGFGIPILDAQLLGLPVVCTDIPIFKEVGEDSVVYAQNNAKDFAKQIAVLIDSETRKNIIEKGYKNITRFDNNSTALQFQNLLSKL